MESFYKNKLSAEFISLHLTQNNEKIKCEELEEDTRNDKIGKACCKNEIETEKIKYMNDTINNM